ncbi:hypothetical protein SLEP1_g5722 [Rubroshorea leprosula]|uniref:UBC core domain-containing protein n=1 Tax=Rubroshorea leprosula TaxID=152421 RepID=A0AAV5HX72_9ROSI|nr:hypothetical protein SLEP1_g5722 [Rubroshorea leprosula]
MPFSYLLCSLFYHPYDPLACGHVCHPVNSFTLLIDISNLQVESIVLSIISMLSSPNDESPANVDAAKEWREQRDEFKKKVRRCVRKSQEML